MQQTRIVRLVQAAVVVAGITGLGAAAQAADAAPEFKIGFVVPLTGPIAELGKSYIDGAEVALAMVNASGGIGGLPTRMIMCDSQSQEQQAVICTKKLINDDQVNLMIGATGTPQTMATIPTIENIGIPLFAVAAGRTAWVPMKKWVFKLIQANDDHMQRTMMFLKEKGWLKVALIRDNGSLGKDISDATHTYAKAAGVEIVTDESMASTDTDVTAQITRIRSAKPDVVMVQGPSMPANVLISKKIVQLGITAPLMISANSQLDAFVRLVPDAVAQSYWSGSKLALKSLPDSDPLSPTITAFAEQYKKMRNGALPTGNSGPVADGILFTQSVGKAIGPKVLDRAALRDAIESANHVAGLQGFWTFSPTDHGTSFVDGLAILKYADGEWVAQD